MSRSMIEANEAFFSNVLNSLIIDEVQERALEKKHCISTSVSEKKWLQNARILYKHRFSRESLVALIQHSEILGIKRYYLCFIGSTITESIMPDWFNSIEINAGLATLFGAEGYLTGSVGKERRNQIIEHIYYETESALEYHQWSDIEMCFPKIRCFQIETTFLPREKSIEEKNCFYWLVCGAILFAHETINPYDACAKDAFLKIASEIFYKKVHYRNILMSYMASSWEIAFLYLYQCIEETFSSAAVKSLWHRLKVKISSTDLSILLNEELSWRARDMEGLNSLIKKLRPESTCGLLFSQLVSLDNLAKRFYKLRNKIVHDTKDDDINYTDEQWNYLIGGSLYLIIEACIND